MRVAFNLMFTIALTVSGCASPRPAPAPANSISGITSLPSGKTLTSANQNFLVAYSVEPDPIPLNEPFVLSVEVRDARNQSRLLSNVALEVDGRMPHHRHGMNRQPQVRPAGDGTFTVEGMLFHMPGRWELYFDITRDGRTERAQDVVLLD